MQDLQTPDQICQEINDRLTPELREVAAQFCRVRYEAQCLEQQARKLRKEMAALGDHLEEVVPVGSAPVEMDGYVIEYVQGRASVAWKAEFERVTSKATAALMLVEASENAPLKLNVREVAE